MRAKPASDEDLVQIGVLAERVGLSLRTVRYYEEVGLLTPSARSKGGFRLFGPEQEHRLVLLKTMKPLGFTLEEMSDFITLLDDASRAHAGSKRAAALLSRIEDLRSEIALRRANLTQQVAATQQLSAALESAARGITVA